MESVLVGMFDSRADAERARTKLLEAGFSPSATSMHAGDDESASTSTTGSTGTTSTGMHADEGVISRFFHSLFGSDDDANTDEYAGTYREAFRRGAYGLTVQTTSDSEADRAEQILNDCGAIDVDERSAQWRNEGWTGNSIASGTAAGATAGGATGTNTTTDRDLSTGATRTMPVVEEELKVGKRTVSRGGVRIYSRVVEVPVEESVRLREEHANVQRRTVDRPATEADFAAFKEGTIEVRETSEEAVVSKDARVVGEVEVGKTVSERDETVRDTVRKTQVEVEKMDDASTSTKGGTTPLKR